MALTQQMIDAAKAVLVAVLDATDASGKNVSTYNGALLSASAANANALNGGLPTIKAVGIDTTQLVALMTAAGTSETAAGKEARRLLNLIAALVPDPVVTPTPSATPFTIQGGASFADFGSAHAAAKDGDTILVQPGVYPYTLQGWAITKALTVDSAVAGQMVTLAIARRSDGVIGAGISIDCVTRHNNTGSTARWKVTIRNVEVYADGLTYVTGKCAVDVGLRSGTCPLDLTLQNVYLHDYDQGIEADNEYDPADRTSTITVLDSRIEQTGCIASGDNNHSIYIGYTGALTLRNTEVKNVKGANWTGPDYVSGSINGPNYWPVGMLVKSRAKTTTVDGCTLIGSANSNAIEYGDGGDLLVTNTHLEAGQWCDGNAVLSYGRFYPENNRDATHGEIISEDGRTNRIRISGNKFVNNCLSQNVMQWIEVSERCTQAGWTAAGRTGAPPTLTYQITPDNTFTDNSGGKAIDPTKGYPGLTASQVFGIPLVLDGSVQTVAQVAQQPPVTQPPVTQPPITPTLTAAPAWYDTMPLKAWAPATFAPSIYSQQAQSAADKANPDDLGKTYKPIAAAKGDSAGYVTGGNKPWPYPGATLNDGSPAVPGYADFRGDQGMCLVGPNAKFVRRGVTYTGWFIVSPAQGGHGVGLVNQMLVRHVETGLYMDATQQSIPPMGIATATALGPDGVTQIPVPPWRPDDGRWYSTHGYNSICYDDSTNRVLWTVGPAQVVGPQANVTYAYQMDGDGWAGPNPVSDPAKGKDYFDTSNGAYPNGRNSCQCIDSDEGAIWNSYPNSPFANPVLIARAPLAQGSKWSWVQFEQGNGPAQLGGASCVSFPMKREPWLIFQSEVLPHQATILNRRYKNANGRLVYWNVAFAPLNGDPINAIPTPAQCDPAFIANVDGGIPATVAYDPIDRIIYACVFCLGPTPLMDVYEITPPPVDASGVDGAGSTFVQGIGTASSSVVPWSTRKIAQAAGSAFQLPSRGNSTGGFYPSHKTMNVVRWKRDGLPDAKGLWFEHDPAQSPIFFKLVA